MLSTVLAVILAAPAASESAPQEPIEHTWNLQDLYASPDHWVNARVRLLRRVESLEAFKGHLGEDGGTLAACLENVSDVNREVKRFYSYAWMQSDADTRVARHLEKKQQAVALLSSFKEKSAYVKPEILSLAPETVQQFLAEEPRLKPYAHFLENIARLRPHTLSTAEEELLAATTMVSDAPSSLYSILTYADIPWPAVRLSTGEEVRVDQAAYTRYRAARNRRDREKVYQEFWGTWKAFERTMGVALYSQLKKDQFYAQTRGYPDCLTSALNKHNVPVAVYEELIRSVNANLPTLHRYLKIRQRMLGLDELRYHDVYPPLVTSDATFSIDAGKDLVLESLEPLGSEYVATVQRGFESRWMDVYPRTGKRAGAYSNGNAYDVHPYILLNFNEDYESVSVLAHEWGHAMHSHLANTHQPFATADYAIFVAEVASTFNEALLLDHVLKSANEDEERLYYLGSALEGWRQTFFRQAMFAEFELEIHRRVEAGEALSGESLSTIYGDILRRYHGHEKGVMIVDDLYDVEWAYIPHFYRNFYVYKYATSLAASSLFARNVLDGVEGARERYLAVLEAGGAEYPYELLRDAGVDLATPAPYEAMVEQMNAVMDEIEVILDASGPKTVARR